MKGDDSLPADGVDVLVLQQDIRDNRRWDIDCYDHQRGEWCRSEPRGLTVLKWWELPPAGDPERWYDWPVEVERLSRDNFCLRQAVVERDMKIKFMEGQIADLQSIIETANRIELKR